MKVNVGEQNQACPDNHSRCIGLLAMPTSRRMSAGALLHRTGSQSVSPCASQASNGRCV